MVVLVIDDVILLNNVKPFETSLAVFFWQVYSEGDYQ